MPEHASRKTAIREYARTHGISYSQARRDLGFDKTKAPTGTGGGQPPQGPAATSGAQRSSAAPTQPLAQTLAVPATADPGTVFTLGLLPHPVTSDPTPVRVDAAGRVVDQHVWRGHLYWLTGFATPAQATDILAGARPATLDGTAVERWRLGDPMLGMCPVINSVNMVSIDPRLATPRFADATGALPPQMVDDEAGRRMGVWRDWFSTFGHRTVLAPLDIPASQAVVVSESLRADVEFDDNAPVPGTWDLALGDEFFSLSDPEIALARFDQWTSPCLGRFLVEETYLTRSTSPLHPTLPVQAVVAWAEHSEDAMQNADWFVILGSDEPVDDDHGPVGFSGALTAQLIEDHQSLMWPWKVEVDAREAEVMLSSRGLLPSRALLDYDPSQFVIEQMQAGGQ